MKITDYKIEELSNAMQQYYKFKITMLDTIVFFQLGDFYEMFFEDAVEVSNLLELTLTGKSAGLSQKVPMAGIPISSMDEYIRRLMVFNKKIAIVSQDEGPVEKGQLVKRSLTKIVTPGTYLDISSKDYNYTASVILSEFVHVAYGDLSTGDMFYMKFLNMQLAIEELISLNCKEVINVNDSLASFEDICNYNNMTITNIVCDEKVVDTTANLILFDYFKHVNCDKVDHLKPVVEIFKEEFMTISINTQKQLDLVSTIKDNEYYGSFFWYINKTNTAMGRRLLKKWILNPLLNETEIYRRQNLVSDLLNNYVLAQDIDLYLKQIYDFERLIIRISELSITPKEIVQLRKSLKVIPELKNTLSLISNNFDELSTSLDSLDDIYNILVKVISEEPSALIKDGDVINDGVVDEIDELRKLKRNSTKWLAEFELSEREVTGIKNLKIRYNKIFGYFIEVPNSNNIKVPEYYIRKQTMSNCERYITDELKIAENKILNASDELMKLEYIEYNKLKEVLKNQIQRLQSTVYKISFIDVISSFSKITQQDKFVCPIFTGYVEIKDSFHPVIKSSTKNYIVNDVDITSDKNILLITGPNMAGKSTYMRQLILINILAQMGCYVPASSAKLKLYDKIYSRIGASDDVALGKSTFMVEMSESAEALKLATKNSLLIFDELGRGTSTYDGIALAQSIIEYIDQNLGCDTLFSTHYHELVNLEDELASVKNIHVKAILKDDVLTFYHKIAQGGVEKSFGIDVAKLADLPLEITERAKLIIRDLEISHTKINDQHVDNSYSYQEVSELAIKNTLLQEKLNLFNSIDINNLSPLEVVNLLNKCQNDS